MVSRLLPYFYFYAVESEILFIRGIFMNCYFGTETYKNTWDTDAVFDYPAMMAQFIYSFCQVPYSTENQEYKKTIRQYFADRYANQGTNYSMSNKPFTGYMYLVNEAYKYLQAKRGLWINGTYYPIPYMASFPERGALAVCWETFNLYWDWFISQVPVDLQRTAKQEYDGVVLGEWAAMAGSMTRPDITPIDWPRMCFAGYKAYMLHVQWPTISRSGQTSENQRFNFADQALINITKMPVARTNLHEIAVEDDQWLIDENERLNNLVEHYKDVSSVAALPKEYLKSRTEKAGIGIDFSKIEPFIVPGLVGLVLLKIVRRKK